MPSRLSHALPLLSGLICAALFSGSGEAVVSPDTVLPVAGLSVTTDPSPALVYLDGVFIGEASGKLIIHTNPGAHQLRVSESGYLDVISDVKLTEGQCANVQVTLPAPTEAWPTPPAAIAIAVGQVMRGKLARGPDGKGVPVRYSVDEKSAPHRMLTRFTGECVASVTAPDGTQLALTPMAVTLPGVPGSNHHEYKGAGPGGFIIEISGKPGAFSFRLGPGLPALSTSEQPGLKGRRLAPGSSPR